LINSLAPVSPVLWLVLAACGDRDLVFQDFVGQAARLFLSLCLATHRSCGSGDLINSLAPVSPVLWLVLAACGDRDLVFQDFVGQAAPGARERQARSILVATAVGFRMTAQARCGGFQ
jgi:hypothetical protein